MKQTCITTLVLFFSLLLARPGYAQLKGFSVGPYLEGAWPRGSFADTHTGGIGVGLAANVKLGGPISAIGSYGVLHFGAKSDYTPVNALPLRLGLKYRLPFIYFKLEGGQATFTKGGGSTAIVSPGVGIRVLGLDVQGSYEAWLRNDSWSFASLKVAYHF